MGPIDGGDSKYWRCRRTENTKKPELGLQIRLAAGMKTFIASSRGFEETLPEGARHPKHTFTPYENGPCLIASRPKR